MKNNTIIITILFAALSGFISTTVFADQGDWLVRGRIINVSPNDGSSDITNLAGTQSVGTDSAATLEVDFTYMLTSNVGLELILATTEHDLTGGGTIAGLGKIADAGLLPPTLTLQYHFQPKAKIRPYAGIGINYTHFYDEKASGTLVGALGATSVDIDDSWGLAAQAGADFDMGNGWFFNVDLKYINIETDATLNSSGTIRTFDVDINPWVFGVGFGTRF